jgi:pilus assembly protein TadC
MSHLRRTWSYVLVAADEHAFDDAVRDYMRAARKAGMPIERVIVTVKQELGTLTPIGAESHRAGALVQRAVQIVITEFFEPG